MNAKKLKLLIASFGLVAYLLSSLIRVDGVVLCLGQDGHVELENAASDLSCKVPPAGKGIPTLLFSLDGLLSLDHCGPCQDFPLTLSSPDALVSVVPIQDTVVKIQLIAVAQFNFSLLPIQATISEPTLQHSSASQYPLAALRTVILLI